MKKTAPFIKLCLAGTALSLATVSLAHAGGFAGGYVASRLLDPLVPERINHLLAALICIGLSVLSIVASVVHGLMLG